MHNLLDIIQRQLVVGINCTPDAGVVSCLFEPDSHTICSSDMSEIIISINAAESKGIGITYPAIGFFANELVLERCVRW